MPKRIQRQRTKGWKMPEGAVYVGRPSKWGNPFSMKACKTRAKAKRLYRAWLVGTFTEKSIERILGPGVTVEEQPLAMFRYLLSRGSLRHYLHELRGKDLMCWCPLVDKDGNHVPCHADVLLEIANS